MKSAQAYFANDEESMPRMPSWVTAACTESIEDIAFLSGAALATLHLVIGREDVPHALLRARLALRAAEACAGFIGRMERAGELRDAVHLLRPGDQAGPAGEIYLHWQQAVARPVSVISLQRALPQVSAEQIATWLSVAEGGPVVRAATVLEAVLVESPRAETMALIFADAILAQSLGWKYIVPLLATELKQRDLRKRGNNLQLACHKAVVASVGEGLQIASDLARRAGRLRAVTPKLRAKGARAAVALFLSKDALSPSAALTCPTDGVGMSDRAARRLCDRLVDLGVVRELTGRDTFRLYGV